MEEKKVTSDAQKRATKKYLSQFIDLKVRVTPKGHEVITAHAKAQGESTAAFIRRAIFETMERDNALLEEEAEKLPDIEEEDTVKHTAETSTLSGFLRKRFGK